MSRSVSQQTYFIKEIEKVAEATGVKTVQIEEAMMAQYKFVRKCIREVKSINLMYLGKFAQRRGFKYQYRHKDENGQYSDDY